MTTPEDSGAATNNLRFKRRKTTHTKRARINDEGPATNNNEALDATSVQNAPEPVQDEEDSVPNLKEILRNRKRPRDRPKDATRRPEVSHMDPEHGQVDAPKQDRYTSRFVAQTGQVVDSSDAQMATFVEARLAEQNHRKYGWPIPAHLRAAVATLAPDLKSAQAPAPPPIDETATQNSRTAAGQGKLEEVALSATTSRSHKDWARLDNPSPPPTAPPVRLRRDGKPFRNRNRRTSDDMRRDALVDAVLHENKIDFFDAAPASEPRAATDDDMLARFEAEYYESMQERAARKPPAPTAKDAPKGPKLGGSRAARAAMREREEAAAAKKR